MDFYAGDGLSVPPDHGGVRQTLSALPRGDQFCLRLPHPPVHDQSRGLGLCPPHLRQTLVPLGPGAAAGDGGADAPGMGAGHQHRGPLRRRGDGGAAGGAAAVCGGGGEHTEQLKSYNLLTVNYTGIIIGRVLRLKIVSISKN